MVAVHFSSFRLIRFTIIRLQSGSKKLFKNDSPFMFYGIMFKNTCLDFSRNAKE